MPRRVFPKDMHAAKLLKQWLFRLKQQGVQFRCSTRLVDIIDSILPFGQKAPEGGYTCDSSPLAVRVFSTIVRSDGAGCSAATSDLPCDATVLALGGGSYKNTGSDGAWVGPLRSMGVSVKPLVPSNVGFVVDWDPTSMAAFFGQPLKNIAATVDGVTLRGELMLTEHGVRSGVVYAHSARLRDKLERTPGLPSGSKSPVHLILDLKPRQTADGLAARVQPWLALSCRAKKRASLAKRLTCAGLPASAYALLALTRSAQQLREMDLAGDALALAEALKHVPLPLLRPWDLDTAISSAGGVCMEVTCPLAACMLLCATDLTRQK
jgi:predicted flavoprotein YhiN